MLSYSEALSGYGRQKAMSRRNIVKEVLGAIRESSQCSKRWSWPCGCRRMTQILTKLHGSQSIKDACTDACTISSFSVESTRQNFLFTLTRDKIHLFQPLW